MSTPPVLHVGILGATTATESIYTSILSSLPNHYTLTIIHTTSNTLEQNTQKHADHIPQTTTNPDEVINHPAVTLIINLLPFDHHEQYTLAALESGKHVMVEVPLSLSIHGLRRVRDARKKGAARSSPDNTVANANNATTGPKVFVGCARRYAPCFTEIFKKELSSLGRVYYARCRNITGPSTTPVPPNTPGTGYINGNAALPSSLAPSTSSTARPARIHALLADIFGSNEDLTRDREAFCLFLGTLGGHDLSLIRESLGFPDAVSNISIIEPFYSAMFHYTDDSRGVPEPFTLVYEAGVDGVPRWDAHLTVYGERKSVSVLYDFSGVGVGGEGVAVRVVVEEAVYDSGDGKVGNGHVNGYGNGNGNGNGVVNGHAQTRPRLKRTEYVSTARETYEQEFLAMHAYLVGDAGDSNVEAKTTAEDALDDLKLMRMIFDHYDRQCGTIRTPLG
ncbi:Oxidoreductase N-terminal [Penicillium cataractarum]|uniref:Oxidoreductase N-terminal n=1 Tax=Penicillium cataractarum TaxID=2100454 RepID=A0A9W9S128_9EURO|nr:Oxidoreductase N-terminal [Penicillium cataractarum]KAJ5368704.1 Oxidoreductase N-terminal [Penicillium cataractarum]